MQDEGEKEISRPDIDTVPVIVTSDDSGVSEVVQCG